MNSAISYLRSYCSQIVKLILFFYSVGSAFFSSYYFFLIFVSSISHSCFEPTISLLFLSFCSMSLPPFLTKPMPEHQAKAISITMVFFFWWFDGRFGSGCVGYGFGVLDRGLMCSSNFMGLSSWVWVCGSSMWPAWIVELTGVDRQLDWSHQHGSSTWLAWVSDRFGGCWNCGG